MKAVAWHGRRDVRVDEVPDPRIEEPTDAIVGDSDERHHAGDVFEVPRGVVHQMAAEGPARVRWEVRPALRTAEFFSRLYSGDVDAGFLEEFAAEFRLAPSGG